MNSTLAGHPFGKCRSNTSLASYNCGYRYPRLLMNSETEHIYGLERLPFYHRDPFDRMLIAQAQAEEMSLISSDSRFADYAISVVW
jgi:hypothetical protein